MGKAKTSAFVWGLFALGLGCGLGVSAGRTVAGAQQGPTLWTEREARATRSVVDIPSLSKLVSKLRPSVANLETRIRGRVDPRLFEMFGMPVPEPREFGMGFGSAFVIHEDGLLLTNSHLVEEAQQVRVKLGDGTYHVAEVVGLDPPTDIALLRISAGRPLRALPLGDSDRLEIGDWVVAIGNPFGLEHTVTAGIVSAKERHDIAPSGRQSQYYNYIQTDAAINPGNSGGPLFDLAGDVVGINGAVNREAQGVGFAIPINMAKELLPALRERGTLRRSRIGIGIQPLTPDLAQSFGLEATDGALVNDVMLDSPAAQAGVRVGDVVVEFDGRPITSSSSLPMLASTAGVGRRVEMTIVRRGTRSTVQVRLDELPNQPEVRLPPAPRTEQAGDTGLLVRDLTPPEQRVVRRAGVLVTTLADSSAAAQADVQRDDVIVAIGDEETPNSRRFSEVLNRVPRGRVVRLLVLRRSGGTSDFVPTFVAYRR